MQQYTEMIPKGRKLAHPYPIALSPIKSHFGFYCYRVDGGFCFHNFHARYAAAKFIALMTEGHEYKWLDDNTILLDNGTRIRGEQDNDLERAIDCSLTKDEQEWEPTEPEISYIRCFLGQSRVKVERNPDTHIVETEQYNPRIRPEARKRMAEEEKIARKKAKAKSGDYITISQICQELKHPPRVCRAMLRKLKLVKPAHGWAWPKSEAEDVKKRLAKLLK